MSRSRVLEVIGSLVLLTALSRPGREGPGRETRHDVTELSRLIPSAFATVVAVSPFTL